jgi:hypothetical protein
MVQDGWIETDSAFAVREHSELAARLINESADLAQRHIVPALLSVVDVQQVEPEVVGRIREVLERSDGEAVFEPEEGGFQRILSVRARVLARQNDLDSFCRELRHQAARCALKWPHERLNFELGGIGAPALVILANAGFEHAAALPRTRAERMAAFSQGMLSLADGWPNALRAVIGILDGLVIQLDVATASVISPVLMELRGRA